MIIKIKITSVPKNPTLISVDDFEQQIFDSEKNLNTELKKVKLALYWLENAMHTLSWITLNLDRCEALTHETEHEKNNLYENLEHIESIITTYANYSLSYFRILDYLEGTNNFHAFNSVFTALCNRYDALCAKCSPIGISPIERDTSIIQIKYNAEKKYFSEFKHKVDSAFKDAYGAKYLRLRARKTEANNIQDVMKIDEIRQNAQKAK